MTLTKIQGDTGSCVLAESDSTVLADGQSDPDLLMTASYEADCKNIALDKS